MDLCWGIHRRTAGLSIVSLAGAVPEGGSKSSDSHVSRFRAQTVAKTLLDFLSWLPRFYPVQQRGMPLGFYPGFFFASSRPTCLGFSPTATRFNNGGA
ncbi:hypothetical protein BJX63DRAFT_378435 [Aspergillus granulosus]|uniref:Uncharacterized protein n=1 Tax=Aspergillus granulosus TaxID=176169 RepID=A0ABR4I1A1_9EURO